MPVGALMPGRRQRVRLGRREQDITDLLLLFILLDSARASVALRVDVVHFALLGDNGWTPIVVLTLTIVTMLPRVCVCT